MKILKEVINSLTAQKRLSYTECFINQERKSAVIVLTKEIKPNRNNQFHCKNLVRIFLMNSKLWDCVYIDHVELLTQTPEKETWMVHVKARKMEQIDNAVLNHLQGQLNDCLQKNTALNEEIRKLNDYINSLKG